MSTATMTEKPRGGFSLKKMYTRWRYRTSPLAFYCTYENSCRAGDNAVPCNWQFAECGRFVEPPGCLQPWNHVLMGTEFCLVRGRSTHSKYCHHHSCRLSSGECELPT